MRISDWSSDVCSSDLHDGDALPGAPEHRFNAAASYGIPLGRGLLTLRGDIYYQSESENALSLNPKFRRTLDGFTLLNASATWSLDAWDVTLWMKNLTNEAGVTGVYTEQYMGTLPAEGYSGNGSKAMHTMARQVGMTVGYRFCHACRHAGRRDDRRRTGAAERK